MPEPFFTEHMKKFVNREVVVVIGTMQGQVELKGVCEAVDFGQKNVIIKNAEGTFLIKTYLWMRRAPRKAQ